LRIGQRRHRLVPEFRVLEVRLQLLVGGHMPRTENLPRAVRHVKHPFLHHQGFVQLCEEINVKMERAVALDLYGRPVAAQSAVVVWNMFRRAGRVPAQRGERGK